MWNKCSVAFRNLIVVNVHQVATPLHHRVVASFRHCAARRPKSCCSPPMMGASVAGGPATIGSTSSITTLNGVGLSLSPEHYSKRFVSKVFNRVCRGSQFCASEKIFAQHFSRLITP
jgi:hypothetical protein